MGRATGHQDKTAVLINPACLKSVRCVEQGGTNRSKKDQDAWLCHLCRYRWALGAPVGKRPQLWELLSDSCYIYRIPILLLKQTASRGILPAACIVISLQGPLEQMGICAFSCPPIDAGMPERVTFSGEGHGCQRPGGGERAGRPR